MFSIYQNLFPTKIGINVKLKIMAKFNDAAAADGAAPISIRTFMVYDYILLKLPYLYMRIL